MTKPYTPLTLSHLGEDLACLHLMDPQTPAGSAEVLNAIAETRAGYRQNLEDARRAYPLATVIGHVASLCGLSLMAMSVDARLAGTEAVARHDALDRQMAATQDALDQSVADLAHRREAAHLLKAFGRGTRGLKDTAQRVQNVQDYLNRPSCLYAGYDSLAIGSGFDL